jgi:hypothetical protein
MHARATRSMAILGMTAGVLLWAAGARAQETAPQWTPEGARAELAATLASLDAGKPFDAGVTRLEAELDSAVEHATGRNRGLIREIDAARRLASQLSKVKVTDREIVYPVLRENPELASTLAFLIREPDDDPPRVYRVLSRLCAAHPKEVARYPALAAAICVVHDAEFPTGATGTLTAHPDAIRIFEHLVGHRQDLVFDLDELPAELLVHMVDTGASQEEIDWAFQRSRGDRVVGMRYHDVPYDTRFFKVGAEKKIGTHAYTLENIRQYGGVCTDQAYYAATVGKAIGVPTAIVSGRASEVGHCWVGFVKRQAGRLVWDFEEGRYKDFEDVRGLVRDPQTGKTTSDDEVAMLADLAATSPDDRWLAEALLDAAGRTTDAQAKLALLEEAAGLSPGNADVWRSAAALSGEMSGADRRRWADALESHFGSRYPSFTITILRPLIESVADTQEQARLWTWAHAHFSRQNDLACEILIAEARMWERDGDTARAYDGYVDAATRYLNESSEALDALRRAETILKRAGKASYVLGLYEDAWRRVKRPSQVSETFIRGTTWFRVGARYALELQRAGRESEAQTVLRRIGAVN